MNFLSRSLLILFISVCLINTGFAQKKSLGTKPLAVKPLNAQEIAKRFLPSVVLIMCDDSKGRISQGSGFFVEVKVTEPPPLGYLKDGDLWSVIPYTEEQRKTIGPTVHQVTMVLTNFHVVKQMVRGKAKVATGGQAASEWWIDSIEAVDIANDLALLRLQDQGGIDLTKPDVVIMEKPPRLPDGLNLSDSKDLSIGEEIYVLSNPKGLSGTLSKGMISGSSRQLNGRQLLQIDAPISAGSSGGAVLNARGEVIGIATGTLGTGQSLNFAVPSRAISNFVKNYGSNERPLIYRPVIDKAWSTVILPDISPELGDGQGIKRREKEVVTKKDQNVIKPSLEETTSWITSKLESTKPDFNRRIDVLRFQGCEMIYRERFMGREGFEIVSMYSSPLTYLESVETGVGSGFDEKVFLEFNQNVSEEKLTFYLGEPFSSEQSKTARIVIFTLDSETAKRVQKAFLRLKETCSVKLKEPF